MLMTYLVGELVGWAILLAPAIVSSMLGGRSDAELMTGLLPRRHHAFDWLDVRGAEVGLDVQTFCPMDSLRYC